jgi:rod shape-determining protein MreD
VREPLALLVLGTLALMLQGAAALWLPARFVPDLGLLLVVAIAVGLRSTAVGLVLALLLGYATDLLSGSLLGQHALLRLLAYGAARSGSARLNLRGPLPQMLFVALLSAGYAAGLFALAAFFTPGLGAPLGRLGELLPHALVTALAAPLLIAGVARLLAWVGEEEGPQRLLPYQPRKLSP